MVFIDLTRHIFGRWTVLYRGADGARKQTQWVCQCVCGTIGLINGWHLRKGHTQSCGCLQRELARERFLIHGMTGTPEFDAWNGLKSRCLNPKTPNYANYGGRGIMVCESWEKSFAVFYADMRPRPSPEYSIERRNNNGPYSPGNCYWATIDIQQRNTRTNHMITINGYTACLAEWFQRTGILPSTYKQRVKRGWPFEKALTTPARPLRRNHR